MFRTLIIEDDALYRQLMREALSSRFPAMKIEEAGDGRKAWRRIMAHVPDLILMDIHLPGDNGLVQTKKIKNRFPEVVVIILTNYDLPEYRDAANQYQANYFLSKKSATKTNILALVESIVSDQNRNLS